MGEQAVEAVYEKPYKFAGMLFKEFDIGDYVTDEKRSDILIVEDNMELLHMMAERLKHEYNVYSAKNGVEAINKLAEIRVPDLIVSDIMMDEMDGIILLKSLRAIPHYQHTPFLLLSARSDLETKLDGYANGAIGFVSKPFHMDELAMKIGALITSVENQKIAFVREVSKMMKHKKHNSTTPVMTFEDRCRNFNLSHQEIKVVQLFLKGRSYRQVADELFITSKTVSRHASSIFRKMNIKNRFELIKVFEGT